jgi:2-polyprenyl-3-methyl-5-hydroxy-6-metoxy-1,4-benzoquinol methylase
MERLTVPEYWDAGYVAKPEPAPLDVTNFRFHTDRRIVEKIDSLGLLGQRVLEIGAGNSAVLSHLAKKYGESSQFAGLDYSESGCQMLKRRADAERVRIRVLQQDLFDPDPALIGGFDRIYSIGVVEHFTGLSNVLLAMKRMLAHDGAMLTVIPNMAGVIGSLTRHYNRAVYDLHVPHKMQSFLAGHREAALTVEAAGYLCSTNFGVLSSCFVGRSAPGWTEYLWLSRLSKFLWYVESKLGDFPVSAALSPYLYAISRAQ